MYSRARNIALRISGDKDSHAPAGDVDTLCSAQNCRESILNSNWIELNFEAPSMRPRRAIHRTMMKSGQACTPGPMCMGRRKRGPDSWISTATARKTCFGATTLRSCQQPPSAFIGIQARITQAAVCSGLNPPHLNIPLFSYTDVGAVYTPDFSRTSM